MPKSKNGAGWPRLEIYLPDEDVRRRVKLAAAAHDEKLSEYCYEAVLERLEQDEEQSWGNWQKEVADLRTWQEQVRARLKGRRIPESAGIIRRLRKQRTGGLTGLR